MPTVLYRGNTANLALRVIWKYFTYDLFPRYPELLHLVVHWSREVRSSLVCVYFFRLLIDINDAL